MKPVFLVRVNDHQVDVKLVSLIRVSDHQVFAMATEKSSQHLVVVYQVVQPLEAALSPLVQVHALEAAPSPLICRASASAWVRLPVQDQVPPTEVVAADLSVGSLVHCWVAPTQ